MLLICSHRGCKREREEGLPFCRIHWTDQVLSSASMNKHNSPTLKDIIPWSKGTTRAERLLLVLIYYEGFSPKEIGATLDLSESTIRKMHRQHGSPLTTGGENVRESWEGYGNLIIKVLTKPAPFAIMMFYGNLIRGLKCYRIR